MSDLKDILSAPQAGQLGLTLLHFVWQGALVAAVLAVALRLLRKRSAGVRYVVATVALLILAVAPVATVMLVERPVAEEAALDGAAPESTGGHMFPPSESESARAGISAEIQSDDLLQAGAVVADAGPRWVERVEALLRPWLPYVVGVWVLGVSVLLLWRLIGWTLIRRLTRRSVLPVSSALQARLAALAARLRVTRPVRLLISGIAVVPSVIGWFRPVVLLPVAVVSGLTPDQLEAILAHELAHIRRHDYLVNMVQVVIETLLFYHPAVWWISSRIRAEREACCDDLAVATCGNRIAYARALSAMEDLRAAPSPSVAATGGDLLTRIRRIVGLSDADSPKGKPILAILTVVFILGIGIPLGCMRSVNTPAAPTSVVAEQDAFALQIGKALGDGWVLTGSGVADAPRRWMGKTRAVYAAFRHKEWKFFGDGTSDAAIRFWVTPLDYDGKLKPSKDFQRGGAWDWGSSPEHRWFVVGMLPADEKWAPVRDRLRKKFEIDSQGEDDAEEVYRGRRGASAVGARNSIHANPTKPPVDRRYEKLSLEQLALRVLYREVERDGPDPLDLISCSQLAGAWYMWKTRDNAPARQKLCDQILAKIQGVGSGRSRPFYGADHLTRQLGPLGGREQIKTLLREFGPKGFYCCAGPALIRALGVVGNKDDVPFLIAQIPKEGEGAYGVTAEALSKMLGVSVDVSAVSAETRTHGALSVLKKALAAEPDKDVCKTIQDAIDSLSK